MIESTYSVSSLYGLVSSKRRLHLAAELLRPGRNSGRSTWRGRCADSRWAREESACARARRTCWSSRSSRMISRMKFEGPCGRSLAACSRVRRDSWSRFMRVFRLPSRWPGQSRFKAGFAAQHFQRFKQRRRVLRPHTATRIGWNIWPALMLQLLGARRAGPLPDRRA